MTLTNRTQTTRRPERDRWVPQHLPVRPDYTSAADELFRTIFAVPRNAASYVRATFPPKLTARLDLNQLALVPGSLVDDEDRLQFSDLLFSVPMDGKNAFVRMLIDHDSTSRPAWAFGQVLRYVHLLAEFVEFQDSLDPPDREEAGRILSVRRHRRGLSTVTYTPEPVMFTLVAHHGCAAWSKPFDAEEVYGKGYPKVLLKMQPTAPFIGDDLSAADGQLRSSELTPAARLARLLLERALQNGQLAAELAARTRELREVLAGPGGAGDFATLMTFIRRVSGASDGELAELAAAVGPGAEAALTGRP